MVIRELITRLGFSIDGSKLKQYEQKANRVAEGFSAMTGVVAAAVAGMAAFGIAQVSKIADEWTSLDGRIGLVTSSAEEQAAVLERVYDISNRTRQETTATGDLYSKLANTTKEFGASQDDVLSVTEAINKALVIGHASTAEAKSTILQFGQAMGSGRLQGDELRSLGENARPVMELIAKAYGVSVGKLKDLGAEGELTSEGVFKAILAGADTLDAKFNKMPLTIGQAVTVAGNKVGHMFLMINKETKIFTNIANGIVRTVNFFESRITKAAKAVGGWNNILKATGMILGAVALSLVAIKWGLIARGIASIATALRMVALNPVFLAILALMILVDELYTWMSGGDSYVGDWLGPWEQYADRVNQIWSDIQSVVAASWDDIVAVTDWGINALKTAAIMLWQILTGDSAGSAANFESLWDQLLAGIVAFAGRIGPYFIPAIMALARVIYTAFAISFQALGQLLGNVGMMILYLLRDLVVGALSYIASAIAGFMPAVAGWLSEMMQMAATGIVAAIEWITTAFSNAIASAKQFFSDMGSWAIGIIQNIGSAIVTYILDKLGAAGQWLAKLSGFNFAGSITPGQAASGGGSQVNWQQDISIAVPPGTSAEQASYLQGTAERTYTDAWSPASRQLRYSTTG